MAGQLCDGKAATAIRNAKLKNSKAFCEGYLARSLATSPTNPHVSGEEAYTAFAAGVAAKLAGDPPGCCAPCGAAAT